MDFGFTNSEEKYQQIIEFRECAVADGWSIKPTYKSEPIERAATLEKEGYKMLVITRQDQGKWKYAAKVSCWGPDGISILILSKYNWDSIATGVNRCSVCKKEGVETERVAFASRACKDCAPGLREKLCKPGWCD